MELGFLIDGWSRAVEAIRADVERHYAHRLTAASPDDEQRIRVEIETRIRERIALEAPRDALY